MSTITLRDYQEQAVHGIRQSYAHGNAAPLLVLPTGGGKTVTFTYITAKAAERGTRICLLAHRKELVGQISTALSAWGVDHGIIAPSSKPTNHPVQVAMVQTLAKRIRLDTRGRFQFGLIVIDECHHAVRDSQWGEILDHNRVGDPAGAKILGVSATPCRLDGKGLGIREGGFFDDIIVGPTVQQLIDWGSLARPVVYAPDRAVDLSGVKKRGGDYAKNELAARMDQATLIGDAVAHYRQHCDRMPAIAFTVTTDHAAHVVEDFKRAGYQAAVLTGQTPDKERAQMIRDLGTGKLHILASCNVVSEGTDIPTVMAAIMLRPTASYALAMQQMGRALRKLPGKDKAIILDHAGNSHKHGLPTEAVDWSLAGADRKSKGEGAGLMTCYDCRALIPKRAAACPECGKSYRVAAETRSESGATQDAIPFAKQGQLVEMTPERRREIKRWRARAEQKAETLDDFRAIGQACGYKPGWAKYRYEELRGAR